MPVLYAIGEGASRFSEIPRALGNLMAYRARLLDRPSFRRCIEEARRFRHYFPLGAPDRD